MTVVPAQVAGVERIVVASPADRDGASDPVLLGAAGLLEVDAFVVAGGAQAIGALAFGLPDAGLEPVDRIVGPGQRLGDRGQARGLRRGRHRPAGRPVGGASSSPRRPPTRAASPRTSMTQAEHGPDSPAILVTTDAAFADAVEAAVGGAPRRRLAPRHPRAAPCATTAGSSSRRPRRRDRLRQRLRARAPLGRSSSRSSRPSRGCATPGSLFVGPWAPESAGDYATGANHVLPTGGLARGVGRPRGRGLRQVHPGPADHPRGPRGDPPTVATLAEAEGLLAHRDAVETPLRRAERRPMSPTPVTFASPTAPALYTWEATDEEVAARYGVPIEHDRPLRPEHLPGAARPRAAGPRRRPVRDAAVRVPAVRLPPPGRGRRRPLRRRARRDPRRCRAPTRSSTSSPRRSSPPGGAPSSRSRPTRCTGSLTEQRGATRRRRPAARPRPTAGRSTSTRSVRPQRATPGRLAVQPEQPDRPRRARRRDRDAPRRPRRRRRRATRARPPIVVLDEAYAEFVGRSLVGLRGGLPEPGRRPHGEQGVRAGRACGSGSRSPSPRSSPG